MSISIIQSVHAVAWNGVSVPFGATGGTEPYSWSIISNQSGGVINSSTGAYVSGPVTGTDVIQVTDSLAATAQFSMSILTPLELVCDIIQTAMGLSQGQVYLWDQKINIPIDSNLYVAVGITSCKPFGNDTQYVGNDVNLVAIQSVNMLAQLSVDILSRGPAARDQKEQVLLAFNSPYAESQMELNSFYIAPISTTFLNLSTVDGMAIPYRFQIAVNLQYFVTLSTTPPYYDTFTNPPTVVTEA